jgi:hypothetical protein
MSAERDPEGGDQMNILFDNDAKHNSEVEARVLEFLERIETRERGIKSPVIVCQDGRSGSYYTKCAIPARIVYSLLDLDARLDPNSDASFRANRELLLNHNTYKRMRQDAENGREFNDLIVEYSKEYSPEKPLKVWGGQHRSKAIQEAFQSTGISRFHGFRVYFCLSKEQRTELALVSNTNIAVSNDLFDRLQEETLVGTELREWCWKIGLLQAEDDFPDKASTSEKISVKLARTFIVNFFLGMVRGEEIQDEKELDKNIYEPYLCESGAGLDPEYDNIVREYGSAIWSNQQLIRAGTAFAELNQAQRNAVKSSDKIKNLKSFRNKALTASVLAGWSFVAGLLQSYPQRLENHLQIPKTTRSIPDPLNAQGMSTFRHDQDPPTYRGLGTRSDQKERQRMAQVFLAKSTLPAASLDEKLLDQAVHQVVGIQSMQKGYFQF